MSIKVGASILSANFLVLGEELKKAEEAGCDFIHVDIMDGHYVKNMAVGLCVAKWLKKGTSLRLDAHLAVTDAEFYVEHFVEAGMDAIIFHPDSCENYEQVIDKIRKLGAIPGLALSVDTDINKIEHVFDRVGIIDQLAVNAGFPNQVYNLKANNQLSILSKLKQDKGYEFEIQVDGGINLDTYQMPIEAGADSLISGSTIFESDDMQYVVNKIRR